MDADKVIHAFGKGAKGAFETFDQQPAHEFVQVALLQVGKVALFLKFCQLAAVLVGVGLVNCPAELTLFTEILVDHLVVEGRLFGGQFVKKLAGVGNFGKLGNFTGIHRVPF